MDPVNMILSWAVARLKEPSSWAGIGLFVHAHVSGAMSTWLANPQVDQNACLLGAAVLAIFLKERQPTPPAAPQ